ncbi:MAG TPA: circadian clock protein KaiC [Gemmataceae bacterium]
MQAAAREQPAEALPKARTGIQGLDEITGGGLPRGRPTLVCGGAGCGKTLLAAEFLVRGATEFGEPGVFIAFEETAEELARNVRSLGFDLDRLAEEGRLAVDFVHLERGEIEETGEYDLEALFLRLGFAIDSVGAKRVVLDTVETLFAGLSDEGVLRAELRRLFRWLKDRGITAVVTAEKGEGTLTRHGLEEYLSDCVILLDHRVADHLATRHLRVVKYRGTAHGTNEYPFLINEDGIEVFPVTSVGLDHPAPEERVSTGIPGLDAMLEGKGYFRGSSVLISGTAGTGKSSLCAHFADAACRRGERCLFLAFEESRRQLTRNMRSVGLDLEPWFRKGLLHFHAARPTLYGLEMHLATAHKLCREFDPHAVVLDPVSNLHTAGSPPDARAMLLRLIDFLKGKGVTTLMTSLTRAGSDSLEETEVGISSLIDTWLLLRDVEQAGERNRVLYVLKSRGMGHSNQLREFRITPRGIELVEPYLGPEGVLTGSARVAQEARERAAAVAREQETDRKRRELQRKRELMEARVAALRAEFEAEAGELARLIAQDQAREEALAKDRAEMARIRKARAGRKKARPDEEPRS